MLNFYKVIIDLFKKRCRIEENNCFVQGEVRDKMKDIVLLCKQERGKVSLSLLLTFLTATGSLYILYSRMAILDMLFEQSSAIWYQLAFLILNKNQK